MKPVLIRQHVESAPAGLLGKWLDARGLASELQLTWEAASVPDPAGYAFIASLGHDRMAGDLDDPAVAAERELLTRAVERDVPVLGLCYGGQVLADVLGGVVEPAAEAELGWHHVQSGDAQRIPDGPWLEWHYQRFTLPPGTQELARSPAGVQAFASGPHLGTQFHPESTIEIVKRWADSDRERLEALRITDAEQRLEAGRGQAELARANAFQLFDDFWERAQRRERRDP